MTPDTPVLDALRRLLATTPAAVYTPATGYITTRTRTCVEPFTVPDAIAFADRLARYGIHSTVLAYGIPWTDR